MNIFPEKETADSIISLIKQKMPLFESFEEVYLFGSILDSRILLQQISISSLFIQNTLTIFLEMSKKFVPLWKHNVDYR